MPKSQSGVPREKSKQDSKIREQAVFCRQPVKFQKWLMLKPRGARRKDVPGSQVVGTKNSQ